MREIEFRGKTAVCQLATAEDSWVYGGVHSIYKNDDTCYITVKDYFTKGRSESLLVNKNTIGQYTGLKDKNGKKIFEGDIVKASYFGKRVEGKIAFVSGTFALIDSGVSDNQLFIFSDIEVIGNIHDNPELLKED